MRLVASTEMADGLNAVLVGPAAPLRKSLLQPRA